MPFIVFIVVFLIAVVGATSYGLKWIDDEFKGNHR